MKKILLAAAFLVGSVISALAACTNPVVMHDFPGTSFNMSVVTAPTGANDCQSNVAIPTWAGGTLGAMAAYGTSPGAVLVPGVNAFVTNTLAPGQAAAASSSPVVLAKNSGTGSTVAGAAVGTAGTPSTEVVSVQGVSGGTPVASSIDPCNDSLTVKSFLPITATTSLVKVIATGTAAKKLYICQINLVTTAANNVAVFEATTATTCATSAVAVYGAGTSVATAANGYPFPANGGISLGNGLGTVGSTTVNNNDLCIGTSAATPLTGGITYATK